MAFRPYPVPGRALRQIMRRHGNEIPPELLPPEQVPAPPPGVYVLSTRRPGAVGGPS
ncbi:hypothetical protein [Streptomyces sp. enrichment culture]|uniref:hypothetical protein n=1 Tax=Streptomyces sp. enrichment culture TaxID=1795815 RepID=UPI003F5693E5